MTVWLALAQRGTALIMAPLVIGHLIVMILAVRNGLSAEEILSRTRGSAFWAAFYGLFVLAVAVHASIGLRSILAEWIGLRRPALDALAAAIGLALLLLGGRAVVAVVS